MEAAPELLRILRARGIRDGLVIDLGCGSGRWARELTRAGYEVLGVDPSEPMLPEPMLRLARKIAPRAKFARGSLFDVRLPECAAITSIGECINYTFPGARSSPAALRRLFQRAFRALRPGGVFVFDFATPARLPQAGSRLHWREGRDWAIASVTTAGDGLLRRCATCFRRSGRVWHRSQEVHTLCLYEPRKLIADLRRPGFRAHRLRGGRFPGVPGMAWVLAVKPSQQAGGLKAPVQPL